MLTTEGAADDHSLLAARRSPLVVGLTGNIACGKSTVLRRLAARGAGVIDADAVTRAIQERGQPGFDATVALFGPEVIGPDGELDRRAIGHRVFADPAALARLEAAIHPLVRAAIARQLATMPEPVIVIDAIKLLESPLVSYCREIWVVTCTPDQQVARLVGSRGLSEAEAWLRVQAQPPQAEKVARATVVIDNAGSLDATLRQVDAAWARLVARYGVPL
jgi:dephospho-CoA kinase